jgi:hypothetical protein
MRSPEGGCLDYGGAKRLFKCQLALFSREC